MRVPAAILLLIGFLVLVSGCLQQLSGGSSYTSMYRNNLVSVPIADPSMVEECQMGTCWCMVCSNGSEFDIFPPQDSLVGGYCFWEKNCTREKFNDINNGSINKWPGSRQFMIGQGPSISDYANANTYCADQLSMAVQWLTATPDTPYIKPDPQRAMCLLGRNVIPVYVLYSKSENIDETRAQEIANTLATGGSIFPSISDGHVGPVVVVTEMDFDPNQVSSVADQVRAIDAACNDREHSKVYCQIAVAPRFNNYSDMDAIMNELGADENMVDFIAFGVNGSSVHGCEAGQMRMQVLDFASYALYNWSKPTIIPYVLFDVGTNDSDNSCTWEENEVAAAYGAFLGTGIQEMRARGIVGISAYNFNTSSTLPLVNPLNCTDCAVAKTEGRFTGWYGQCQAYAMKLQSGEQTGGNAIVFANASGGSCPHAFNNAYGFNYAYGDRDITQPQLGDMHDAWPKEFACDACMMTNTTKSVRDMFKIEVWDSVVDDKLAGMSAEHCTNLSTEIDTFAGAFNIDPMVIRAIIMTESHFNKCAASRACKQGYNDPDCFQKENGLAEDEGYSKGYDEMFDPNEDPATNCPFVNAEIQYDSHNNPLPPKWRWVCLGIMQSCEPPYTFWPGNLLDGGEPGPHYEIFDRSGWDSDAFREGNLVQAKECNLVYNPFTPGDSICMGVRNFKSKFDAAHTWLVSYHSYLNWQNDLDKDKVFQTYIALNKYAGFWDSNTRSEGAFNANPGCDPGLDNGMCWMQAFHESWTTNETYCTSEDGVVDELRCKDGVPRGKLTLETPDYCYGYTDFIEYVHDCQVGFLQRPVDPGAIKLGAYARMTEFCADKGANFCPDGAAWYKDFEITPPVSGTPYIPDPTATVNPSPGLTPTGS